MDAVFINCVESLGSLEKIKTEQAIVLTENFIYRHVQIYV